MLFIRLQSVVVYISLIWLFVYGSKPCQSCMEDNCKSSLFILSTKLSKGKTKANTSGLHCYQKDFQNKEWVVLRTPSPGFVFEFVLKPVAFKTGELSLSYY